MIDPAAAVAFLQAFARAQSRMSLYGPGHPARSRALTDAYDRLTAALSDAPELTFSFVDDEVVLDDERLRTLQGWEPGRKLAEAGIERLEFVAGIGREEFGEVARAVGERLREPGAPAEDASFDHARFGTVAVQKSTEDAFREVGLEEEADAVSWLQEQVRGKDEVDTAVAEAVVLSVGSAIKQSRNLLDLLVPLKEKDEYSTAHSMNVSVLAIGLAESLGFTGDDVRSMGEAALLHDMGKQRVPTEILQKPAGLTDEEWKIIRQHPEDGARLLLKSDDRLDLAAMVAYEHHMEWNGGGYPQVRYHRRPHPASQLIQICDVYDALRTRRPFRDPWPRDEIIAHIHEGAGDRFDPEIVRSFASMIETLETEQAGRGQEQTENGQSSSGSDPDSGTGEPGGSPGGGASRTSGASGGDGGSSGGSGRSPSVEGGRPGPAEPDASSADDGPVVRLWGRDGRDRPGDRDRPGGF